MKTQFQPSEAKTSRLRHGVSRRAFIRRSLGASTLLAFHGSVPAFLSRSALAASAQADHSGTVIVVLQLSGGNDGLNTVVPFENDVYHRKRPTLHLTPQKVLKIDGQLGFHPEMTGFERLFKEGLLTVVQGVGYPRSSRDHPGAMLNWHTARPRETAPQVGWLGRAIDQAVDSGVADAPGAFVGPIRPPFAIQTERVVVPVIRNIEGGALPVRPQPTSSAVDDAPSSGSSIPRKPDNSLLDFLRETTVDAIATSERIERVVMASRVAGGREYPRFPLAQTLRTIGQLIRADTGIRIYFAELGGGGIGGFDTHAGQNLNHGALLRELSASVEAFINDLKQDKLAERVLLITFSEFGRTVEENGRRGTGHGAAAPVFIAGGSLKGGLVGAHPSLSDLDADAPKFHTDFRQVYATMLDRWLGLESQPILDGQFAPLDILRV